MVDNFEQIRKMFYFNEGNNMFFHCQIVQRAKDHKPEKVREGAIKTYFIRSKEHLDRLKDEIVLLCKHYKARAYINVAGKDFDAVEKLMLVKLANNIQLGNTGNPRKCLNSAAGECKSRLAKWIVDVDDVEMLPKIQDWLYNWYLERWKEGPATKMPKEHLAKLNIYATVPTVQGCHLIVAPFNTQAFGEAFPDVDIHKNSMGTLLYCPDPTPRYRCSQCGGTNVQIQAWIDPNTNQYISDIEGGKCWCEDCEEETGLTERV